jgi:hypothetical protein
MERYRFQEERTRGRFYNAVDTDVEDATPRCLNRSARKGKTHTPTTRQASTYPLGQARP